MSLLLFKFILVNYRRIENPRILLLDCNLEYKKGESQVNLLLVFIRCLKAFKLLFELLFLIILSFVVFSNIFFLSRQTLKSQMRQILRK